MTADHPEAELPPIAPGRSPAPDLAPEWRREALEAIEAARRQDPIDRAREYLRQGLRPLREDAAALLAALDAARAEVEQLRERATTLHRLLMVHMGLAGAAVPDPAEDAPDGCCLCICGHRCRKDPRVIGGDYCVACRWCQCTEHGAASGGTATPPGELDGWSAAASEAYTHLASTPSALPAATRLLMVAEVLDAYADTVQPGGSLPELAANAAVLRELHAELSGSTATPSREPTDSYVHTLQQANRRLAAERDSWRARATVDDAEAIRRLQAGIAALREERDALQDALDACATDTSPSSAAGWAQTREQELLGRLRKAYREATDTGETETAG